MLKKASTLLACVLVVLELHVAHGQRLSQGASDWYMRFHTNFDFVKRNAERPVTKSFAVDSLVKYRYAVTTVHTVIFNPASTERGLFNFGFVMPKSALVSQVKLVRASHFHPHHADVISSRVNVSDWMIEQRLHGEELVDGLSQDADSGDSVNSETDLDWDLIVGEQVDFKQFVLPIRLEPLDEVTLSMTYEYLLSRQGGKYRHDISVYPGEIVKDFRIRLTVEESSALKEVKMTVPVLGDITEMNALQPTSISTTQTQVDFNMSEVEQFHYFGRHGFAGDFQLEYDVDGGRISQDGYFVHFYNGPKVTLPGIPMYVILILDASQSMASLDKIRPASESIKILLASLGPNDYFNLILFNETGVFSWNPQQAMLSAAVIPDEQQSVSTEVVQYTPESKAAILELLDNFANETTPLKSEDEMESVSHLSESVLLCIKLANRVREKRVTPDNALTMITLISDGRSIKNRSAELDVIHDIKMANREENIPIFSLGVGYDANMDFLRDISQGGQAQNVIEEVEVGLQIKAVLRHVNYLVLKDVQYVFAGGATDLAQMNLTQTKFQYFHEGSSILVSGVAQPGQHVPLVVTAQSAEGGYEEVLTPKDQCSGSILLCSDRVFKGACHSLNSSLASLKKLGWDNRAASVRISGDCAWEVYDQAKFKGQSVLLVPGSYESLSDMYRKISSIKMVPIMKGEESSTGSGQDPLSNSVARLWAFLTIQNTIQAESQGSNRADRPDQLIRALKLSSQFGFLTPFTDMYLESEDTLAMKKQTLDEDDSRQSIEPDGAVIENNLLTYKELSPVLFQRDDLDNDQKWAALKACRPPVRCVGHFHVEDYHEERPTKLQKENLSLLEQNKGNCTGTLTLFTRPKFRGDWHAVQSSLSQIYHAQSAQHIRSIRIEGDCCWLIFDHRFFAGEVERLCGTQALELRRSKIGSIKLIGSSP